MNDEPHQVTVPPGIWFLFRGFEGHQDPGSNLGRIFHCFQAGSQVLPILMPEIVVARAGCDDHRVATDLRSISQLDLLRVRNPSDSLIKKPNRNRVS